jgi:hypothetical protein
MSPQCHYINTIQYLHPTALPEFHRQQIRSFLDVGPKRKLDPMAMEAESSPESACEHGCWNSACTASPAPGQNASPVRQASPSPHKQDNRTDQIGISSSLEKRNELFKFSYPSRLNRGDPLKLFPATIGVSVDQKRRLPPQLRNLSECINSPSPLRSNGNENSQRTGQRYMGYTVEKLILHYARSWKIRGSNPNEDIEFFDLVNPSSHTMRDNLTNIYGPIV